MVDLTGWPSRSILQRCWIDSEVFHENKLRIGALAMRGVEWRRPTAGYTRVIGEPVFGPSRIFSVQKTNRERLTRFSGHSSRSAVYKEDRQ
jgi:hypothetical protein